ncbi:MAG: GNAT family N-acetyltransferase [Pseudomonadota bacterium]|nr:GNAT family N-acetyltransferase [Pseudomonadota bacterium]
MTKTIFVARTSSDLERCFPIIKELRPHLNINDYFSIYEQSHKSDGYEIIATEVDGKVLAVMGYRILFDYVRGKHMYVDDLVSTENSRSRGLGAELLNYAESMAKELNCSGLRLCTGIENEGGIKFYEKNGWTKRAFAYSKKIGEKK